MEALPYDADTFDLVTGFTSFFFANDMVAALREAGRVAKPGAPVVIQVWGAHENCSLEAMKEIARPFFPPRPPDAPPDPDLSRPGALEGSGDRSRPHARNQLRHIVGLHLPRPRDARPGARRPAGVAILVGPEQEDDVKAAIVNGLAEHRTPDGSYRLDNEYHYLVARA